MGLKADLHVEASLVEELDGLDESLCRDLFGLGVHPRQVLLGDVEEASSPARPDQQQPPQVLQELAVELAGIRAIVNGLVDEAQAGRHLLIQDVIHHLPHHLGRDGAEEGLHLGQGDLLVGEGHQLVQQTLGVTEAAGGAAGDQLQSGRLNGDPFLLADAPQFAQQGLESDAVEVEALAAGEDRGGDPVRLCGGQDKDDMGRRLLQSLQQGVEGLVGQHMYFIYNIDLVAGLAGGEVDLLSQVANLVYAPIGGGINLDQVQAAAFGEANADGASAAGLLRPIRGAVDRLGQDAGHAGLARPPGAGEEVSVAHPAISQGVPQGARHVFLADHLGEGLGTPSAI